jgi:hypothetical protein
MGHESQYENLGRVVVDGREQSMLVSAYEYIMCSDCRKVEAGLFHRKFTHAFAGATTCCGGFAC